MDFLNFKSLKINAYGAVKDHLPTEPETGIHKVLTQ